MVSWRPVLQVLNLIGRITYDQSYFNSASVYSLLSIVSYLLVRLIMKDNNVAGKNNGGLSENLYAIF